MLELDNKEIATGVATKLIEDSIKGAWKGVKRYFKDEMAKEEIDYGDAYQEYLINTKNKNSKIKTLIYRRVAKDLYTFYECIGVRFNGKTLDTCDISNLINENSKIIITGSGGSGKSILLKHLFLNSMIKTSFIPVLIELRSFNIYENKDISLFDYIYENIVQNGFTLEKEYFTYSMEKGGYIIFLDGYDELNRDKLAKMTTEIKSICSKYKDNKYIISSRPTDDFIGWNDFVEMAAMCLTKEQALSLVQKIEFDEKVKDIFYKELESSLFEKYESFASNPLLLNIMLLTFNNHASIPDKLNDFYEQAFATLFNMHDATKDSYVRDIRTGLGCEDFKTIFAYICFKSYFSDEFEFSEVKLRSYIQKSKEKFDKIRFDIDDYQEDLTLSVCMLVKEGLSYRFSHRSFQEYFAAWYTCKLTDDVQSRLLTNWIKESNSVTSDSYFTMLFNLQEEKVNKIILAPGIKQIRSLYEDYGFSTQLLNIMFKGITLNKLRTDKELKHTLSLRIKDQYMCYILMLTCRLNVNGR